MHDLIIIIVLIILNGVFSMSEVALISARKSKLTSEAKNGNRNALTALKLQSEPGPFSLDHTDWNHLDRYSHRYVLRSHYCFRSR